MLESFLCPFFTLIKLRYTKALEWSNLDPGPEAESSSLEIMNRTSFTISYHLFIFAFASFALGDRTKKYCYNLCQRVFCLRYFIVSRHFMVTSLILEKEMATHSSILAWGIPWTEDPGRLQSMGLQSVRHDWATKQQLISKLILLTNRLYSSVKIFLKIWIPG